MKKLLTILFILSTGITYGQAFQWPPLNLYSVAGQAQIRNNIDYADKRKADSVIRLINKDTTFYDKRYLKVSGKEVLLNVDSVYAYIVKPQVDDLNKKNKELTDRVIKLEQQGTVDLTALTNRVVTLENTTATLNSRLSIVETGMITINSSISLLNKRVDEIKVPVSIKPIIITPELQY